MSNRGKTCNRCPPKAKVRGSNPLGRASSRFRTISPGGCGRLRDRFALRAITPHAGLILRQRGDRVLIRVCDRATTEPVGLNRILAMDPSRPISTSFIDRRGFLIGAGSAGMALGAAMGRAYTQTTTAPDHSLRIAPLRL